MPTSRTTAAASQSRAVVQAKDVVALSVRQYGPRDAALTVVLLHGHCQRGESWTYVLDALRRRCPDVRFVSYDHRGHGNSAAAPRETYHLEQLGHDLRDVLAAVAPTGPIVLVGHSMGGMTALTYAGQHPHEIGARIVGVALIATAASNLAEAGFGRLLRNPLISLFQAAVRLAPRWTQRAKLLACKIFAPIVRAAEYGDRAVSPRVLALNNAMHNQTSIVTMASFLSTFTTYNRTAVLPLLTPIPTLALCGSADLMTPPSHSVTMAAAAHSELVLIEGAGHSVILEQPESVAAALAHLLARVVGNSAAVDAQPEFAA
ncbi:alpha/beta hydrolase [Nocardia sp. CDC159]|uniref:Alpha/beta hydrolase n=1 Tax=Nocardia pulmonis TaxID=2951408 RepID=A0A9X2EE98_9NOCA|nr:MULTISPECIES: alpha/beta hydrolase [Nocardia]MCM6778745.1 alpha/beta hydrolase [Nocardia pulmonis]MCM6791634.1 alpha/beta hydrolase [Nocardia sp. CDC159]